MIAEVIIHCNVKNLNRTFDYQIPEELTNLQIGSRVLVPFGRGKTFEEGFVVGIKQTSSYRVKQIEKIQEQTLTKSNIALSKWMASRYFCNISDAIKLMLPPGTTTKIMGNRVKEKTENRIYLKKETEEIEEEIEKGTLKSDKQVRVLRFILDNEGATVADIESFTDTTRAVIKTLEKNGYLEIQEQAQQRNPFLHKTIERNEKLGLTQEQADAYQTIAQTMVDQKYEEFLIYGVTGSGKTEIYLQLMEKVLQSGKTAIMLVPEISLTPQMVNRFLARFGEDVISVLHSKLSIGERYDQWQKIRKGEAKIVIGARSAIFAPVTNLGLIIVDEEHDSSYKSDMTPRYQAKEIARYLAKENKIPLVYGSATPEVNTYYQVKQGKIKCLTLTKRANHSQLPEVEMVDLRQELANGNRSMISQSLAEAIKKNIEEKRQTILFLNRRGFSTFVMCRDCGYTVKCKNCNISLTYHKKQEKLKCHYCGYEETLMQICPECGSNKIRHFGTGTQKLEEEIQRVFPEATTIRMDTDTVTKKNSHEMILNRFQEENIDILIGTQMVVKGHHFPNVTLVGVMAADGSLYIDDYRSQERTFDLLVQVAGRAGRDELPGKVIIQTYSPEEFVMETSAKQDYDLFYNMEIKLRKQLNYPPFCDIIMFGLSGKVEEKVKQAAEDLKQRMLQQIQNKQLEGKLYDPLPAPVDKIKGRCRWRMIIKANQTEEWIKAITVVLEEYYQEQKDTQIRVMVDRNPTNMM